MKSRNSKTGERPLDRLFIDQLADMHSAEKQLARALPLIAKAAHSEDLKALLAAHQEETKGHAETIEEIADNLEVKLPRKTCHAMSGLIKEGVMILAENIKSSALDTGLIAAGLKIEHYEIASYGTLCRWAKELGYKHELAQLISILNQEKLAETLLSRMLRGAGGLKKLVQKVSLEKALEVHH